MAEEKNYNIPLRKEFQKVPKYKRAKKAVTAIKQYLQRHMKKEDIKIGPRLNEQVWERGIKNPPHHVQVTAYIDKESVYAEKTGFVFKREVKEKKKEKTAKDKILEKIKLKSDKPKSEERIETKEKVKEIKLDKEKPIKKDSDKKE
jgi:large subunit ribosomal protein L31e